MKNYEIYADEIREFEGTSFCNQFVAPHILKSVNCHGMDCTICHMLQMIWLLEDYKEPEIDWSEVAVDTPILVRDSEDRSWIKRYFAKYENETIYAWDGGCTSWSTYGLTKWKFAKLAENVEE